MRLQMRTEMRLFDEAQLERMLKDALRVWREVPFRVQAPDEFCDALRAYGLEVDGELVRSPQTVLDKVLDCIRAERERNRAARSGRGVAWAGTDLSLYTHGQSLHICDLETNQLRPVLQADLAAWCRAVDALGDVGREHPTFIPTDVPLESSDFQTFATIVLNSRRPYRVSVYSARMLPFFVEACRIAKGSLAAVKQDPVFASKCWVNSPFMITRENVEIGLEAKRLLGLPFTFGHMPVAGGSGPVTVSGSLVQNTAESLALCAMSLALNGTPCGVSSSTAMLDMRDACQRQTGPDLFLHRLAGAEMNAYLFGHGPATAWLANTSAAVVSPQSVYEKALSAAFNISAGMRSLGIGSLATSDVGSPVQLVLDYEMGLFFRDLLRDVAVDDEHIGLETILETAPQGAYFLATDHTARFFREECWLPNFMDNRVPLAWAKNPAEMIARAQNRTRDLFAKAENQCPLTTSQRREVEALAADAMAVARAG